MSPALYVVDLTTRMGSYALEQLGVASEQDHGHWPNLYLRQTKEGRGGLRIDWLKPGGHLPLSSPGPDCHALAVLVGPGAMHSLPEVLALAEALSKPTFLFVAPTALMESFFLKAPERRLPDRVQVFRLPVSDPQALWLVLLEQLGKLPAPHFSGSQPLTQGTHDMSSNLKQSLEAAMRIEGASAAAIVDYRSGMCLAEAGSGLDLRLAAAGNTEVVRAKLRTAESLGLRKGIEDILITLVDQYHLIRLIPSHPGLFLYLVLDKNRGNLALARYKLMDIERDLKV